MPEAPETYRRSKPDVEELKGSKDSGGQQRGGNGLYQSYRYIKFRARQQKRQRTIDEQRVHDIYKNLEQRSFKDYINWLSATSYSQPLDEDIGIPLCADCLDEGLIKPGRVMDHDTPIEKGGSIWDPENLKFLCDHHHNIKRATEDRK